jgi:hypothetical protein
MRPGIPQSGDSPYLDRRKTPFEDGRGIGGGCGGCGKPSFVPPARERDPRPSRKTVVPDVQGPFQREGRATESRVPSLRAFSVLPFLANRRSFFRSSGLSATFQTFPREWVPSDDLREKRARCIAARPEKTRVSGGLDEVGHVVHSGNPL